MQDNYSRRNVEEECRHDSRKNARRRRRKSRAVLGLGELVIAAVIGLIFCVIFAISGAFHGMIDTAPDISNMNVTATGYATFVYDDEGNQTAKLVASDSNRIPVTFDQIPEDLQHAFVAIEDARFYEHNGIDVWGIIRAAFKGITTGNFSEGASTITQQLIKNSVFTDWTNESFAQSVKRKVQEQYLAVQLEKVMSKDEILTNYLNIINLGHNTLGVQAASQRYFGKSVSDLNLSECAVLAAITQNPTKYDPINYPENNNERRLVVLENMLDQGYISRAEYDEAVNDDPYSNIKTIDSETEDTQINSYFVDALTDQILEDLQKKGYTETQAYTLLYSGGLNIYSTQNQKLQEICDEAANNEDNYPAGTKWYLNYQLSVKDSSGNTQNYSTEMMLLWMKDNGLGSSMLFSDKESAEAMAEKYKESVVGSGDEVLSEEITTTAQPQISLTLEDQRTGEIKALVGGRGTKTASRTLNRATSTARQPGSTFKVIAAFAPALDAGGKTLATTYEDAPYSYEDGTPVRNWYGESYRGWSSIRDAIRSSMNIIAVKTLTDITPQLGFEYCLSFGFTTLVENETIDGKTYSDINQTLALGGLTNGVTNMELNAAYATIANGGEYIEPKLYTKVTDHDGNVILDAEENRDRHTVLKETTAWLLTDAMEDVVSSGTGTRCQLSTTPVAGKTGTTSDENDVWFAGFTNYYTCTTWAGYDENTNLTGSESAIAQLVWKEAMSNIHSSLSWSDFSQPSGITTETVCAKSGKKPVEGLCNSSLKTEYFAEDTLPEDSCDASYHAEDLETIQQNLTDAQTALAQANLTLQNAQTALTAAQQQLTAAQSTGDAIQIETAQQALDQAQVTYDTAVIDQAAAQAKLDEAQAAYEAATGGTDTTSQNGEASAGNAAGDAGNADADAAQNQAEIDKAAQ